MTQGGYQVITILPIKSKMAAAKKRCFLRFLYLTLKEPGYFDPSHSRRGADSAPLKISETDR